MGGALLNSPPLKGLRILINNLNNLFSERNAQNIPVDVQYADGAFNPPPAVIKTSLEMNRRADEELRVNKDPDYRDHLDLAVRAGIVAPKSDR